MLAEKISQLEKSYDLRMSGSNPSSNNYASLNNSHISHKKSSDNLSKGAQDDVEIVDEIDFSCLQSL